jgi:hypothetical protein
MVTPAAEREAFAHLRSRFEMSERRACNVIGCSRMTVRYVAIRADDGALRSGRGRSRSSAGALAIARQHARRSSARDHRRYAHEAARSYRVGEKVMKFAKAASSCPDSPEGCLTSSPKWGGYSIHR